MPELPEVETIRLGLQRKIVGLTIKKVELVTPKSFTGDPRVLANKKITKIWRKAKILGIDLDLTISLLFHLKMTGQLIHVGDQRFIGGHPTLDMVGPLPNKSTRVIFTFNDDSQLYFNDQRRFGWVRISDKEKVKSEKFLVSLGPEPLEKDFTWEVLKKNLLRHKSMPIKVAILDQSVVSGIGNIYASEACFNAKLNPETKVSDMSEKQFQALHTGIIQSLRDGIKYGGSTRTHFVDADGRKGYFLDYAKVYWRDKHPCKVCGTEIKKVQLRGRGTYFCPACQK